MAVAPAPVLILPEAISVAMVTAAAWTSITPVSDSALEHSISAEPADQAYGNEREHGNQARNVTNYLAGWRCYPKCLPLTRIKEMPDLAGYSSIAADRRLQPGCRGAIVAKSHFELQ